MAQVYEQGGNASVVAEAPLDERVAKDMHALVSEAAERVTFHRVEVERWTRVGNAAGAALAQLQAHAPVEQSTPETFFHDEPTKAAY